MYVQYCVPSMSARSLQVVNNSNSVLSTRTGRSYLQDDYVKVKAIMKQDLWLEKC